VRNSIPGVSLTSQPEATGAFALTPGIRAAAVGAFWFSVMGLLVKLAGRRLGSMEIVLFRGVITLGLSWWYLKRAGITPWGTERKLLLLRGTCGSIALMCFFASIVHLPLGEATLIQNMNPVFATVLAAAFLGERLGVAEIICLVASLLGVVFIAQPTFLFGANAEAANPVHIAVAVAGGFFSGCAYTLVRRMRVSEHPLVIVFYLPLMSVPLCLPFALADWRWPDPMEWLLLIGVGVTTQLAQVSMTKGLQMERTVRATTVGYLQVAFAVVWGLVVLGEIPDVWTLLGAVTIIGSILALSWWHRIGTETT
jgi:drug/metabolite transporter (DMT)-like permease